MKFVTSEKYNEPIFDEKYGMWCLTSKPNARFPDKEVLLVETVKYKDLASGRITLYARKLAEPSHL